MNRRARRLSALALVGLLAACSSTSHSDDVVRLIKAERYGEAMKLAAERAAKNPGDEDAARVHRDATVVWHLDRGRQALFARQLEDALDEFNQSLALAPHNTTVINWIRKTRDELTALWLDRGLEFLQAENFDSAIQAYELAEYYSPRHPEALFGATRVLFLINYRQGMGEDYYNQGVRAMHAHYLTQARQKFSAVAKYIDEPVNAIDRRERVEHALAEERLFIAEKFVADGKYGAAQIEYRIILKLQPDNEVALAGLEQMTREVEANRYLAEADKLIRQARFDEALAKLEAGQELTELQADSFSRMHARIEVAHWESLYRKGVNEEQDFRYEEAVRTFAELIEQAEFYEDAHERKATLEDYIRRAGALYAQLDATTDPDKQRAILREIALFWPEYADVQERLAALK